jgi:hypothetical protein
VINTGSGFGISIDQAPATRLAVASKRLLIADQHTERVQAVATALRCGLVDGAVADACADPTWAQ